MITYQITSTAIGVGLALVILWLVRRDHLHGPFAIWWIGVAITVALLGFFTGLFDKLAHSLGITYPPILAVVLGFSMLLVKVTDPGSRALSAGAGDTALGATPGDT